MPSEPGSPATTTLTPQPGGNRQSYMIAPRAAGLARLANIQPMSALQMQSTVQALGVDVTRTIRRSRTALQTLGTGSGDAADVVVANLEPERAEVFRQSLPPNMVIAPNLPLGYSTIPGGPVPGGAASPFFAQVVNRTIALRVLGAGDNPLPGVNVSIAGEGAPAQGVTDNNGNVQLNLVTLANRPIRTLSVLPKDSHWDLYLSNPQIVDNTVNTVRLRAFSEGISGFPAQFRSGWGQRVMGLDQLPKEIRGAGVKIAIIDSGCDNTHPLLSHVRVGTDFTGSANPAAWSTDTVGHGTHCAGIIAGRSNDAFALRGFAPDAEIHILRIFPGGDYAFLLQALDYCIDNQIDVVSMSLGGSAEVNPIIEETLLAAMQHGISCIVAAGNSGDAVKYPASSSQCFAVAAVGDVRELQPNTWDSTTVQMGSVGPDGLFSPTFTCFGPQVRVCAPGVGIISTVPGGVFESESGTSMAAPHITGVAALLLAHHPVFQTQYRTRTRDRVNALFGLIQSICTPLSLGSDRTGAGMPNIARLAAVLQAQPAQATAPQPGTTVAPQAVTPFGVPLGSLSTFAAGPQIGQLTPQGWIGNLAGGFAPTVGGTPGQFISGLGSLGSLLPLAAGPQLGGPIFVQVPPFIRIIQ